jgi:hypothetical protein
MTQLAPTHDGEAFPMVQDPHDLTPASLSALCARSKSLVDDIHQTIQTAHALRRTSVDLRRQARAARAAAHARPL